MKSKTQIKYSPTSLHHLTFVLQQLSDELLSKEAGVSLSHVRIMGALHESIPHSQRVLASKLHQTEANISRQIRVMADHGLVKIAPNKKDHRQRDVTLTSKGLRIYEQAEKLLIKQEHEFLKQLGPNIKTAFELHIEQLVSTL